MVCSTSSGTRSLARKRKEHGRRRPSFQSCRPLWLPYCGLLCQVQSKELEDQHCLNRPNHVHVHGLADLRSLAVRRSTFKACSCKYARRIPGGRLCIQICRETHHRKSLCRNHPSRIIAEPFASRKHANPTILRHREEGAILQSPLATR